MIIVQIFVYLLVLSWVAEAILKKEALSVKDNVNLKMCAHLYHH